MPVAEPGEGGGLAGAGPDGGRIPGGGDRVGLPDETVLGPGYRSVGVRAPSAELREWLAGFTECAALEQHRIVHAGIARTQAPHAVRRRRQTSTFLMLTLSGAVRVAVDGEWRRCGPGEACLLPAHQPTAYHAEAGSVWEYAWICLLEPPGQAAPAGLTRPRIAAWPGGPVCNAVEGLRESVLHGLPPALQGAWAEVLHAQVMHFAGSGRVPDAFSGLWSRVSERLGEPWPLERLAEEAHCSREQLRRLCQREFGRSPHNQVIHLRLRHGARLLATTDAKVETVAEEVGYANAFVFSLAFKKWMGCSPSEYRLRAAGAASKQG